MAAVYRMPGVSGVYRVYRVMCAAAACKQTIDVPRAGGDTAASKAPQHTQCDGIIHPGPLDHIVAAEIAHRHNAQHAQQQTPRHAKPTPRPHVRTAPPQRDNHDDDANAITELPAPT